MDGGKLRYNSEGHGLDVLVIRKLWLDLSIHSVYI